MPVQIVITGEHATDAIAELQNLTAALNGPVQHEVSISLPQTEEKTEEPKEEAPKKLSREEQEEAVKEMIEAGEKDDRFDLLTKGRAAKVEKALEAGETGEALVEEKIETPSDDNLTDMFDDEKDEAPEEVTSDMIREVMAQKGKDANGEPVQENLLKIREILTKHVPKGAEVKVGNIPAEERAQVYAELQGLEG